MKKVQGGRIAEAIQMVFSRFPGGLLVFDADGKRVITMNDRARVLLHFAPEDDAELTMQDLIADHVVGESMIAECRERGEAQANVSFQTRSGAILPAPLAVQMNALEDGAVLVLRFADKSADAEPGIPASFSESIQAQFVPFDNDQRKSNRLDHTAVKRMEIVCSGFIIYSVMKELFSGQNAYVHYTLFPDKYNASDPRKLHYDLIVFAMPSVSRYEVDVVRELISYNRHLPVLIVSMKIEEAQMISMIKAGVRGIINDEREFPLILSAVNAIMKGELWCPRHVMQTILESGAFYSTVDIELGEGENILSEREMEILKLVAVGLKNGEVADKLNISYSTVASHVYNIFRKLDIRSRAEAIHYALSHRLI